MERLSKGDAVIHPVLGAGIVLGTSKRRMNKTVKQFYRIKILGNTKTTIMVPVDSAEEIGLRPAVPTPELDKVWQALGKQAVDLPDNNKIRYKVLEERLRTSEIVDKAEIVRDLEWRRMHKKQLNKPAQRIYDKAMHLLAGEIAVSQDLQLASAQEKVKNVLDASLSKNLKDSPT
jgi:CarD family transcriptional regulator